MPTLDKVRVSEGLHGNNKFDLTHDHITTSNFMDMQPINYRHMIPKERYQCNLSAFARLAPLTVPTYGRARLNMRAFFVPFRTVMPNFTEFIVDAVTSSYRTLVATHTGIPSSTPYFTNDELWKAFKGGVIIIGGTSYPLTAAGTATSFDFKDEGGVYYKLTAYGRRFWKVLRSLGYNLIPNVNDQTPYSALSLLCYLRVYFDWYTVSQYMDTASYQLLASWFTYNIPTTPLRLTNVELIKVATFLLRVSYDGDYFTSAWDSPVAPNVGNFSNFVLPDITYDPYDPSTGIGGVVSTVAGSGTPLATHPVSGGTSEFLLTQYQDTALHALTDYMKRHQLVGARAVDRYLADFGINLPADKLQRSTYLGCSSLDIQIGDVMSHADTAAAGNPSNLGDYAGQGYLKGGKSFEYQAAEYGLFIVVSSIMPSGGYVQGYDRNNLHTTKDQFFLPDFDNLGVQAITKGELYISNDAAFASPGDYDGIFGYTPRYAEYKIARDQVTGDFSLSTVMSGGDSWHMMRLFDDAYFNGSIANVQHDLEFCRGYDAEQYSRIFNDTDADIDKFYMIYHIEAGSYAPMQSLFDTYQFEKPNKKITMDANGVKMN